MIQMLIKANKPPVSFYSVSEMAKKCRRSKHLFYKMITNGHMPDANFRKPAKVITCGERKGEEIAGERLYSVDILAPKLIEIFKSKSIKRGKPLPITIKQQLFDAYAYERSYYKNEF